MGYYCTSYESLNRLLYTTPSRITTSTRRTRRMYWWRASIQDDQAFTSAWWRHCSESFFFHVITSLFFVVDRKKNSICGIGEFFYVSSLYAHFQFSRWSRDHFSAPFRSLYLQNAWPQTSQTSKRHTSRVSAFHQYHWFGVKLFLVGCAQQWLMWSREAGGLTWQSQVGANPKPILHPTNLALFGHKITLYTVDSIRGRRILLQGAQSRALLRAVGAEPLWPPHFNHWWAG